jgi:hypothetical protein
MSRDITTHQNNELNKSLIVEATNTPEIDQAHRNYIVYDGEGYDVCNINFQHGQYQHVGVNGVTNEAILAILIDRLECYQTGPLACDRNARALENLHAAMKALHGKNS